MIRKIDSIVIHCSASPFGDSLLIDQWHTERGWNGIGYHAVITNGYLAKDSAYQAPFDGQICFARPVEIAGAHVSGFNENSIGVCLIGDASFTETQMLALKRLVQYYSAIYGIKPGNIFGHYELDSKKTCPNIEMDILRSFLCTNTPDGPAILSTLPNVKPLAWRG